MKKYIIYILLTCLLISCFAGCKQAETTPEEVTQTDVTQTQVEVQEDLVVAEKPEQSEEEKEGEQSPSTVAKKQTVKEETAKHSANTTTSKKQSVTAKKDSNTQSKTEANQSTTSKVDPIKIHGDIAQDNPAFVSEEALQIWLQQGSGAYETQRNQYITLTNKNNQSVFYKLSKGLPSFVVLDKIELSSESGNYAYLCHFEDGSFCQIGINVGSTSELDEKLYKHAVELYQNKHDGSGMTTVNGIDFYYRTTSDGTSTHVSWKQFNKPHSALFHGNQEKLTEFIQHLLLEQVTINLNSDHVTQ